MEIIDKSQTKKINPAIEEAKLQKKKGYAGLKFECPELRSQMEYFQNEVSTLGMDKEDKKAKQIAYCGVLLNQEQIPENVNMSHVIYSCLGDILDRQAKSVESNIGNALKSLWNSSDPEILKKIEQNYHGPVSPENGAPTPREFLLYLVKKYREENPVHENKPNVKRSFIRVYF